MSTETKSIFTGVDYIRLTAGDHKPLQAWEAIVLPELLAEMQAGRKIHARSLFGYTGKMGEHAFVGAGDRGCMIQLSGNMAWSRWADAARHSRKCTRIDLQVTRPVDVEPGEYIREMYAMARMARKREGRQPEPQLVDTPSGAKMLTIGSRQSELYGRMYDKFRESKVESYKGTVRWEIEAKGQTAIDLCAWLLENKAEPYVVRHIVREFWDKRGMTTGWIDSEVDSMSHPTTRTRTDDTKLAWISTQVAPAMRVLFEHGRASDVIRAVWGLELDEEVVDALAALLYNNCSG
jgi:DNA relaxase NicK